MKNFKRNTLMCDFIGAAFCLVMAFAILVMYSGCSEDAGQSPVAHEGGYTEEQASLENIRVVAHARRFELVDEDSTSNKLVSSVAPGTLIRMSELDSVTFDTTGNTYYTRSLDSTGVFSFDSVSLKSPYVMLGLSADCGILDESDLLDQEWSEVCILNGNKRYVAFRLIVDLRKTKNVSVNVVTTIVTKRLMQLIGQGMSFEDAKQQAESEMLRVLGIYGVPYRFDKAVSDENRVELRFADYMSSWLEFENVSTTVASVAYSFAEDGLFNTSPTIRDYFIGRVYGWFKSDWIDKELLRDFMQNFMASLFGLGQCANENEGYSTALPYDEHRNIDFTCKNGNWSYLVHYVVPDSVGAVFGQMTDFRDSTKYKTVTYNIDGRAQTWLAENLKYKSTDGIYFWNDAMDLPDSVALIPYESCLEEESYTHCDSLQAEKGNFDYERIWSITDSVKAAGKTYQGICPDGWHLPDANEWKKLRDYVTEKVDGRKLNDADIMAIAGFREFDAEKGTAYVVKIDSSIQGLVGGLSSTVFSVYAEGLRWSYISRKLKLRSWEAYVLKNALFVRCVKD